jgi:preprotein translocase subunit SecA
LLRAVDSHWVRHLTDLDVLREGIGLRAYGQQNPLVAYKKEAFETFDEMNASIRSRVARDIFRIQAQPAQAAAAPANRGLRTNAPTTTKGQRPVRKAAIETIGRNDPCPCGSGKKYKHCHGQAGAAPLPGMQMSAPHAAKPGKKS